MASDIQLSQAVRQNLLSLQNTADLMSRTQTRLATGNKVNSALDNPTNFFTASGLNARAGELGSLLDSMSNAVSTIEAADKGLTSITKMVEQMQATVRQAMQVKADNLSFTGDATFPITVTDADATVNTDDGYLRLEVAIDGGTAVNLDIYTNATGADQDLTVDDVVDGINQAALKATDDGKYVRARKDDNGALVIEALGGRGLAILADESAGAIGVGAPGNNTNGILLGAAFTGATSSAAMTVTTTEVTIERSGINAERNAFAEQYNDLREQLNDLAEDASFNGINLLQDDDLKVLFNELTGNLQSKLNVEGEQVDVEWLNIKKVHTATSLATYNPAVNEGDFQTDGGLETALDELSNSLRSLRGFAAKLGSNLSVVEIRKDFTKDMVNTLQSGAAKLTLADTNEEGANMLALQTRQQLSSTALSLSSQADQNVLRLF